MDVTENEYTELAADGPSDLVSLPRGGATVIVDCVDENGDSQDWGGASVDLVYSPDGKMLGPARDADGDVSGQTDGFSRKFVVRGFVGFQLSDYDSGTFRLLVIES